MTPSAHAYPPIADYGLIGDMRTCALVSRAGSIDWWCLPRFDGPSVFGRILDWERGGHFQISTPGLLETTRRYLPDTNVLETTFRTDTGVAVLTDFMPLALDARGAAIPLDTGPSQIMRLLHCVSGGVRFVADCRPRFNYGADLPEAVLGSPYAGTASWGDQRLVVRSSAPLESLDGGFAGSGLLHTNDSLLVTVTDGSGGADGAAPPDLHAAPRALDAAQQFWRDWASGCTYLGPDRAEVVRSALALKLLIYAPSGAMVAAPTTSLPERIGGALNWDYRFNWFRDAAFVIAALRRVGFHTEAADYWRWLAGSAGVPPTDLPVMFGIGGERRHVEMDLPHLHGYQGSRPVRIGNAIYDQLQLDAPGVLLDSAWECHDPASPLTQLPWALLQHGVEAVLERWQELDAGIWEARDNLQHYVHSKAMCWLTLQRALQLADRWRLPVDTERLRKVRDEIRQDVLTHGYDADRGAFVEAYGSKQLDAALLQMPLIGFIPATDPRMWSTIAAIKHDLCSPDGLVYRNTMHGLLGSEGAFALCTFWLADNYLLLGDRDGATRAFQHVKSFANDLGLYSEEIDPATGELLGNFPQALSHVGHLNTAVRLQQAISQSGLQHRS